MSPKRQKIDSLIPVAGSRGLDRHYLGYFDCFNAQLFFEAHEALEVLWLPQRGQIKDHFYKGLIQFAGVFVHVQKGRRDPALALLRLSERNLQEYPAIYERLDLSELRKVIGLWIEQLAAEPAFCGTVQQWPKLSLLD